MRHNSWLAGSAAGIALLLVLFLGSQSSSAQKPEPDRRATKFVSYVTIPGATRMGSEACAACHSDLAANFLHGFHAQQGIACEDCHGAGSLHIAGGGDATKIVSFSKRDASSANGACLSCHANDDAGRNWLAGPHASNDVRCTDCHQIHSYPSGPGMKAHARFDVTGLAKASAVEDAVPETKAMIQPRAAANELCLKCHAAERAQLSLPYHHPLREGKMSCEDCHDPHGGPGGNNLRASNTNDLCLGCHAQYRGPFAYQHPPVTENCLLCHTPHGSPNTNLLSVSEPALCLQCHTGHHNGASLPLAERCTDCHSSIHGTDVATPSGGSRFVDKGQYGVPSEPPQPLARGNFAPRTSSAALRPAAAPAGASSAVGPANGLWAMMLSHYLRPAAGGNMLEGNAAAAESRGATAYAAYSVTPAAYRFVNQTGFGGRVGEYDTLQSSAGTDVQTAYVSLPNHISVVSRGNVLSTEDYEAASQGTVGKWAQFRIDLRSFVQQQDHYVSYLPELSSTDFGLPGAVTDAISPGASFAVKRRMGSAYGSVKFPWVPVHLFASGNWQARVGQSQLTYLDENTTPAVYQNGVNTTCGQLCHYSSQFQPLNYTTRKVSGGAYADLKSVRFTWEHSFSSFNDRLTFPTGVYTGPFTPENEGISTVNPPKCPPSAPNCNPGPAPADVAVGNYYLDIPSPNQASSDRVSAAWTASSKFTATGTASYTRLQNAFTRNTQNAFGADETATWKPVRRLRLSEDYHQQNVINEFTPYYTLFGNVSYHSHSEGLRAEYELLRSLGIETYYRRSGITRSNAFLWPQVYSINNTDLLPVIPSSAGNTAGLAARYRHADLWSARAGYAWTGTDSPGFLIIPESNNRVFADVSVTPVPWLIFSNDTSVILQNAFKAIALPNTPGDFQRRDRFYYETASATLPLRPAWNMSLGYSYQQNNLLTYMAFQNDASAGYVVDEPALPYKQIVQAYWGESNYAMGSRFGLNFRLAYNSARSGFRPDVKPNDAALLGNQSLITAGTFNAQLFAAALGNLSLSSTQISGVIVPQWIGQAKVYYLFPRKLEGGAIFYYGSYRDFWNPNLNGVLRTFNFYLGRSW